MKSLAGKVVSVTYRCNPESGFSWAFVRFKTEPEVSCDMAKTVNERRSKVSEESKAHLAKLIKNRERKRMWYAAHREKECDRSRRWYWTNSLGLNRPFSTTAKNAGTDQMVTATRMDGDPYTST